MATIPQRELRNIAAVIAAVAAGETFVITRSGTPVAELGPIQPTRRMFVSRQALVDAAQQSTRIDAAAFRADLDRLIDAV